MDMAESSYNPHYQAIDTFTAHPHVINLPYMNPLSCHSYNSGIINKLRNLPSRDIAKF